MAGRGHIPLRRCAACGTRFAKHELIRFTTGGGLNEEPLVALDSTGKAGGRGVYLCRSIDCYETAVGKRRTLQRKLRVSRLAPGLRDEFVCLSETLGHAEHGEKDCAPTKE